MNIGGFQPLTLSDYPGEVAAIIFTQGCNFRCPFCHNGRLISPIDTGQFRWSEAAVLEQISSRRDLLTGVVITGGEPTVQSDLPGFVKKTRRYDLKIKLDTNGSRPEMLRRLLDDGLLDFIAMDVKAPWRLYDRLAGCRVNVESIVRSMTMIAESGLPHMFRTTAVESLLAPEDLAEIQRMIPSISSYVQQEFLPEMALDRAM